MPQPDFGQMARSTTGFIRVDPEAKEALELNIIDLLRQVWNARGTADLAAVHALNGAIFTSPRITDADTDLVCAAIRRADR